MITNIRFDWIIGYLGCSENSCQKYGSLYPFRVVDPIFCSLAKGHKIWKPWIWWVCFLTWKLTFDGTSITGHERAFQCVDPQTVGFIYRDRISKLVKNFVILILLVFRNKCRVMINQIKNKQKLFTIILKICNFIVE